MFSVIFTSSLLDKYFFDGIGNVDLLQREHRHIPGGQQPFQFLTVDEHSITYHLYRQMIFYQTADSLLADSKIFFLYIVYTQVFSQ